MASWRFALALLVALQVCEGRRFSQFMFSGRRHGSSLVPPPPEEARSRAAVQVSTKYFDQPLDHFNSSVTGTWKQVWSMVFLYAWLGLQSASWFQRYQVNDAVYKQGGPIFVMIGGEGAIDAGWLTYGQMYQNAKTHNALIFQPEHRFYGDSHPTR